MGLYLINISVDPADPKPNHIPEDLSINDQESIIEFAIEKLLGFENAIDEHDDHDTEDHHKNTNVKAGLVTHFTFNYITSGLPVETKKKRFPDFESCLTTGFHQLLTPPPKI